MTTDVTPYQQQLGSLSVQDVRAQVNLIQHIMQEVMKRDEHYGVIPGTGTKPSLLKAGAEKLCLTFRLAPDYEINERQQGAHLVITSKCILTHIPSGQRYGAGMGSCSTLEAKYAFRTAGRKCPSCGAEAIIKGKEEYGGGWVCFKKKGGCGAKYDNGDQSIESQAVGRIANEDVADQYNTVLKMANKRSLVAAVLNATAASDIFTQDIEDMDIVPQAEPQRAPAKQRAAGGTPSSQASDLPSDATAASAPTITPDQHIDLTDRLRDAGIKQERAINAWKVPNIAQLPADQYERARGWIAAAVEKSLQR